MRRVTPDTRDDATGAKGDDWLEVSTASAAANQRRQREGSKISGSTGRLDAGNQLEIEREPEDDTVEIWRDDEDFGAKTVSGEAWNVDS